MSNEDNVIKLVPEPPLDVFLAAQELHTLYVAYLQAGFTKAQAMDLIKTMVRP